LPHQAVDELAFVLERMRAFDAEFESKGAIMNLYSLMRRAALGFRL